MQCPTCPVRLALSDLPCPTCPVRLGLSNLACATCRVRHRAGISVKSVPWLAGRRSGSEWRDAVVDQVTQLRQPVLPCDVSPWWHHRTKAHRPAVRRRRGLGCRGEESVRWMPLLGGHRKSRRGSRRPSRGPSLGLLGRCHLSNHPGEGCRSGGSRKARRQISRRSCSTGESFCCTAIWIAHSRTAA